MPLYMGSALSEILSGTQRSDSIYGLAGNDELIGLGGADSLYAGEGNDTIRDDFADPFGTPPAPGGNDLIYGDPGNDLIFLSHGADTAFGNHGDDTIRSDLETDDVLLGGRGNDRILDFSGSDVYRPGRGDDYVVDGNYMVTGPNDGADRYQFENLPGGFGSDTILGFDKGYGDRLEFVDYTPSDLLSVSETDRATVFAFKDGSMVTALQDERQVLHGLEAGKDYLFTS